jgi:hypothetical protein
MAAPPKKDQHVPGWGGESERRVQLRQLRRTSVIGFAVSGSHRPVALSKGDNRPRHPTLMHLLTGPVGRGFADQMPVEAGMDGTFCCYEGVAQMNAVVLGSQPSFAKAAPVSDVVRIWSI